VHVFAHITVLAADVAALPAQLGEIFYTIVFPILLIAGVGWLIQRRLGLDMPTMTRLNFYFLMPAMAYFSIVTSPISGTDLLKVVVFTLCMIAANGLLALGVARVRRVSREHRNTMLMTTMFYNSGNYGLPLQKLAFENVGRGDQAFFCQIFVMLTQNIVNFTLGIWLAATGRRQVHWKQNLLHILKFPPVYALTAGLLTLQVRHWLGENTPTVVDALAPFRTAIVYLKEAFIAVALCTLGAQLALVRRQVHNYPVKLSVVLKLLVAPGIAVGLTYLFGLVVPLDARLAQILIVSASVPTAVNVMLLCLEFDNNPDYAARAVFYSTMLSPVTVTLTIFIAKGNFLAHLVG